VELFAEVREAAHWGMRTRPWCFCEPIHRRLGALRNHVSLCNKWVISKIDDLILDQRDCDSRAAGSSLQACALWWFCELDVLLGGSYDTACLARPLSGYLLLHSLPEPSLWPPCGVECSLLFIRHKQEFPLLTPEYYTKAFASGRLRVHTAQGAPLK
jgi:hypothetical protein